MDTMLVVMTMVTLQMISHKASQHIMSLTKPGHGTTSMALGHHRWPAAGGIQSSLCDFWRSDHPS